MLKNSFSNLLLPEKVTSKNVFMVYEINVQLFLRQVVFSLHDFHFQFMVTIQELL